MSANLTIIGTSTSSSATTLSAQRKSFLADGYIFQFWFNGSAIVYATSPDGINWSNPVTVTSTAAYAIQWAIDWDETYVYIVFGQSTLYYQRGTVSGSPPTISWGTKYTAYTGSGGAFYYPDIVANSNGLPFIGFYDYESSTTYGYKVVICSSGDGSGIWASQLVSDNSSQEYGTLVALTNGMVYVLYLNSGALLYGRLYSNGSWATGTGEVVSGSINVYNYAFSATAIGNNVLVVFLSNTGYYIYYNLRTYGSGWGALTEIQSTTQTTNSFPVIVTNDSSIWVFWVTNSSTEIDFNVNIAGSWLGVKAYVTGRTAITSKCLTIFAVAYSQFIALEWTEGSASPYNVISDFFAAYQQTLTDEAGFLDANAKKSKVNGVDKLGLLDSKVGKPKINSVGKLGLLDLKIGKSQINNINMLGFFDSVGKKAIKLNILDRLGLFDVNGKTVKLNDFSDKIGLKDVKVNKPKSVQSAAVGFSDVLSKKMIKWIDPERLAFKDLCVKHVFVAQLTDKLGFFDRVLAGKLHIHKVTLESGKGTVNLESDSD